MEVMVEIRLPWWFRRKIDIRAFMGRYEIWGCWEHHCLSGNIPEGRAVVCEAAYINRGVKVEIGGRRVFLSLRLPAAPREIDMFYAQVHHVMNQISLQVGRPYRPGTFRRNGERANREIVEYIREDIAVSQRLLNDMLAEARHKPPGEGVWLLSALYPLCLGAEEAREIEEGAAPSPGKPIRVRTRNGTVELEDLRLVHLGRLLRERQSMPLRCLTPRIFSKVGSEEYVGVYEWLRPDIPVAALERPMLPEEELSVNRWYVLTICPGEETEEKAGKETACLVPYDVFLRCIRRTGRFDAARFIGVMDEFTLRGMARSFGTDTIRNLV